MTEYHGAPMTDPVSPGDRNESRENHAYTLGVLNERKRLEKIILELRKEISELRQLVMRRSNNEHR